MTSQVIRLFGYEGVTESINQNIIIMNKVIERISEYISTNLQDCQVWSSYYSARVDIYDNNPLHYDTEEPFGWQVCINFDEEFQYEKGWITTHPENDLNVLIDEYKSLEECTLYELEKIYESLVLEYENEALSGTRV